MTTQPDPLSLLCAPAWSILAAGRWTANYTMPPCVFGRAWAADTFPAWVAGGTPPTWAALIDAILAHYDGWGFARWIVVRWLLVDRALLTAWAREVTFVRLDAQIEAYPDVPDYVAGIRGELLRWATGADVDWSALSDAAREVGYELQDSASYAAAYSAYAAVYAVAYAPVVADDFTTANTIDDTVASAASYVTSTTGADVTDVRRAFLIAAIPLLDRASTLRTQETP